MIGSSDFKRNINGMPRNRGFSHEMTIPAGTGQKRTRSRLFIFRLILDDIRCQIRIQSDEILRETSPIIEKRIKFIFRESILYRTNKKFSNVHIEWFFRTFLKFLYFALKPLPLSSSSIFPTTIFQKNKKWFFHFHQKNWKLTRDRLYVAVSPIFIALPRNGKTH